jgi:hypothetical protein
MKPLLKLENPNGVFYCDKPLSQAEAADIQYLSTAEVSKKMAAWRKISAFTWSEDFFVDESLELSDNDKKIIADLLKRRIPSDHLTVCFIDAEVGHGVFANVNIPQGGILFYGGHNIFFTNDPSPYQVTTENFLVLDALESGAHAQLFQDLYGGAELTEKYSHVARNNFASKELRLSCGLFTYYEAKTAVMAGLQCGSNYGPDYWKYLHIDNGVYKQFFDISGIRITDSITVSYLQINNLSTLQILAIKKKMPIDKSKEPDSLKLYSPISEHLRSVVYYSRVTEESLSTYHAEIKSQLFFATPNPFDILLKYELSSEDDASIAFRKSSAAGNVSDIKILLKSYSINIDQQSSNGMTALHWAYEYNRAEAIEFLLKTIIKRDVKDKFGRVASDCATQKRPELHRSSQKKLSA